jgi:21S rRNA (GM2251-2'-O)-methyltransferase
LGAIIRSAYFLGVDALAIVPSACAPLSNVALKASAGAAEAMPILTVEDATAFAHTSKQNGWRVYAGVTPDALRPKRKASRGNLTPDANSGKVTFVAAEAPGTPLGAHNPLTESPCILVLGGEGRGMRRTLRAEAEYLVSLSAAQRPGEIGVDSLNVSVAAAVLATEFLKSPSLWKTSEAADAQNEGGAGDLGF